MQVHDWSTSRLGSPSVWPQPLKTVAGLMLHSKTPAFLAWGPDLSLLYNDAYLDILGQKHPAALGQPLYEVWPDIRNDIEPLVNKTLSGEPVYFENALFTLRRNGEDEPAWFSFSYAPVDGPNGRVAGLYCSLTETTAQVLAEQNRQAETRRLYSLFEQAPSFMAVVREPSHVYELANSAYLRLVGRQDVVGKTFREVVQEIEEIEEQDYAALLDQAYATGKPRIGNRMPVTFRRQADGAPERRFVDFIFQPITGPDGKVNGVFIEGNDVTEHARTEDELRESKRSALQTARHLDAVLQAAPVGIAMVDAQGKAVRANPANRQLWGAHPVSQGVDGYGGCKGWWADGSARHGRRIRPQEWALARALRGEEAPRDTVEIEPFGEPGIRRTILDCGAPVRDSDGNIIGSVVAQMDITDQVSIEAVLRETILTYHTIANAIPQIVWGTRPDGYHDYFNQQWYDYTGVPQGSTHGEGWKGLFYLEDQMLATKKWRHSLTTGEPYEIEYRLRHHSGQYRWTLGRALPVRNEQGAIVRWMGTCTDIHEQKLAQEELVQSDRLKDEFLAMLAHELRNPLAPIATAADLLSMGTLDEEEVWQLSEVISRQAGHMTRLIDDLLDVSRVTHGQVTLDKKPVDMKSIVTEAVEQVKPLLEAKAHHLEIQLPPERSMVSGDRMRLVQVLANVLNNAVRYTPNRGRIALQMVEDGNQLTLCVRDNGMGMSDELIAVAFELFTQGERTSDRTQGGLGLGLALVQSLVRLHGGTVSLQSAGAGLGSELTMVLPRLPHDDGPRRFEADDATPGPAGESLRIMVVDDNVDAARLLGMFVEMLGHQAFVQFHPASALECARQVKPHICLLDIGLPDMDGYTLARQLRQLPGMENVLMAAVTGYSQPRDKQAAFAAGFNFHFAKPINAQQLKSWLADVAVQGKDKPVTAGG
ncbi:PAS domain-containing protein [Polaromonas sp.]|uniref:PAS domain-containing hybrid sensor histidine kinase/response regulator n=1 Tax=Polaromonas sp. TaxID=1869339 RepID=UPI003BB725C7